MVMAMCALAGPGQATVLEISPDGAVIVHDRPAVVTQLGSAGTAIVSKPIEAVPRQAQQNAKSTEVHAFIRRAGDRVAINPRLIEAVAWEESRFNPNALSPKGAVGVMQLMPATAKGLGVDPADVGENVSGGAHYLRRLLERYDGDIVKTLAAYNASPAAVDRYHGVPPFPETQKYVADILARLAAEADFSTSEHFRVNP